MEDAENLNFAVSEAIWGDEGELGQHQLPDIWYRRGSAQAGKCFQLLKRFENLSDHRVCGYAP